MNQAVLHRHPELIFVTKELREEFINPENSRFRKMIEVEPISEQWNYTFISCFPNELPFIQRVPESFKVHRTADLNRFDFVFKFTTVQQIYHFTIQLSPSEKFLAQVKLPMTFVQKECVV